MEENESEVIIDLVPEGEVSPEAEREVSPEAEQEAPAGVSADGSSPALPAVKEEAEPLIGGHRLLGDKELADLLQSLTDLERRYCENRVCRKLNKAPALRAAGSKAKQASLAPQAVEIERRDRVKLYMDHLKASLAHENGITMEEIISNARRCIQIAIETGKVKDADPHNRLLAEIGGYIKKDPSVQVNTQINNEGSGADAFRTQDAKVDLARFLSLVEKPH